MLTVHVFLNVLRELSAVMDSVMIKDTHQHCVISGVILFVVMWKFLVRMVKNVVEGCVTIRIAVENVSTLMKKLVVVQIKVTVSLAEMSVVIPVRTEHVFRCVRKHGVKLVVLTDVARVHVLTDRHVIPGRVSVKQ